jgi:hypothetical protein
MEHQIEQQPDRRLALGLDLRAVAVSSRSPSSLMRPVLRVLSARRRLLALRQQQALCLAGLPVRLRLRRPHRDPAPQAAWRLAPQYLPDLPARREAPVPRRVGPAQQRRYQVLLALGLERALRSLFGCRRSRRKPLELVRRRLWQYSLAAVPLLVRVHQASQTAV